MIDVSLFVALIAGIVSFLSPCILPIIPGFLAYLSGSSTTAPTKRARLEVFINSVFFVLGFSLVFAVLGIVLSTILSSVAFDAQVWLARIGGAIVIFFGLYLMGLLHIGFLEREHKIKVTKRWKSRYFTSFVFGSAFAAGWTPCVGAALGAILGLAATNPGQAFPLLLAYAVGLGLPFLVVGAFTAQAASFINRHAKQMRYVNIVFGAILVVLGVLVFTQTINYISNLGFLNELLLR